jgi:hypothetical protein
MIENPLQINKKDSVKSTVDEYLYNNHSTDGFTVSKIFIPIAPTDTMDLQKLVPLVIYDNKCYLCIKFARAVNFLARGRLLLVGHYTDLGEKLRAQILDSSALQMFWFVDGKTAYGGRAALAPLFFAIISARGAKSEHRYAKHCETGCKTAKAVFLRSVSLLSNSKKIPIHVI